MGTGSDQRHRLTRTAPPTRTARRAIGGPFRVPDHDARAPPRHPHRGHRRAHMEPNPTHAIINATKGTPWEYPDGPLQLMTNSVMRARRRDFAPVYGDADVVFVPSLDDVRPDQIPHLIIPNPDIAGALGYHGTGPNGEAYSKTFTLYNDGSPVPMTGITGISTVVTHELFEVDGNRFVKEWHDDDRPNMAGWQWWGELCDWSQRWVYWVDGHTISDWAYPNMFSGAATGNDYRTFMAHRTYKIRTGPFNVFPGGYSVRRNTRTGEYVSVFANQSGFRALRRAAANALESTRHEYNNDNAPGSNDAASAPVRALARFAAKLEPLGDSLNMFALADERKRFPASRPMRILETAGVDVSEFLIEGDAEAGARAMSMGTE